MMKINLASVKNYITIISITNLIIAVGLIVAVIKIINLTADAQQRLATLEADAAVELIDLSAPYYQDIRGGFKVLIQGVEEYLTGVKIKGNICNTTALDNENVKFEITIADQKQQFTINKIPSGGGSNFEVYVPDVSLYIAKYVQIKYLESMISVK